MSTAALLDILTLSGRRDRDDLVDKASTDAPAAMTHDDAREKIRGLADEIAIKLLDAIKICLTDSKESPYLDAHMNAYETFCRAERTRLS